MEHVELLRMKMESEMHDMLKSMLKHIISKKAAALWLTTHFPDMLDGRDNAHDDMATLIELAMDGKLAEDKAKPVDELIRTLELYL